MFEAGMVPKDKLCHCVGYVAAVTAAAVCWGKLLNELQRATLFKYS